MMKRLIYSMLLILSVVTLFTACQEKEKPPITKEFTVSFNSDGGSQVNAVKVAENQKLSKPTDPTKGDLIFAGWFKEAEGTNIWDFERDVVTKDITLYAKWTTITYTVTFETNGGSKVTSQSVPKGSTATKPDSPTKVDEVFVGWYTESALTNEYDFASLIIKDTTLYAKWTPEITRDELSTLVADAEGIDGNKYTTESYNAMKEKLDAAKALLEGSPTPKEIADAYAELLAAKDALVLVSSGTVVSISIRSLIEDIAYISPGKFFSLMAYAVDAEGVVTTNSNVEFDYNPAELSALVDGAITTDDNMLGFMAKSSLSTETNVSMTVKSQENPSVSMTISLKVADVKQMFLDAVNALPLPENISYGDYEAIEKAHNLYRALPAEDTVDQDVQAAFTKLLDCQEAYYNLPLRLKYSFNGDVCTLILIEGGSDESNMGEFDFVSNGEFPAGKYTNKDWVLEEEKYVQLRLTFTTSRTGSFEFRESTSPDGTGASVWRVYERFTYTFDGNKDEGGVFILTPIEPKLSTKSALRKVR